MPSKDTICYLPKTYGHYIDEYNSPKEDVTSTPALMNLTSRSSTVTFGANYTDWKRRIRKNQQATTTLSGTQFSDGYESLGDAVSYFGYFPKPTTANALTRNYRDYGPCIYSGDWGWPSGVDASGIDLTEARNMAKRYFLRNLIDTQRAFQGGVFVGELRETLRMIRNPGKGLRGLVDNWLTSARKQRSRSLRNSRGLPRSTRASRARRELSDMWLENAFGWQPFINDIDDAARALNRRNNWVADPQVITGYGKSGSMDGKTQSTIVGKLCRWNRKMWKQKDAEVGIYGKTTAYVINPIKFNARLLGFTARDFAPTIWELVPYSFLIDYFTNIGDIIEAYSWGRTGLAWVKGAELRKCSRYHVYSPYKYYSNTKDYGSSNGGFITSVSLKYRYPWDGGFVPSLTFRVPGIGSMQWLNIAALAAGRRSDRQFRL